MDQEDYKGFIQWLIDMVESQMAVIDRLVQEIDELEQQLEEKEAEKVQSFEAGEKKPNG